MEEVEETAKFMLEATTNLEGGKKCRHEVRRELLFDRLVLHITYEFLIWFLETLKSLGTSTARMPPEAPC